MWIIKWIILVIVVIFLIGFAMNNADIHVPIKFYKWQTIHELPLWLVMYLSFVAGMIFWLFISIFQVISLKSENRKIRKHVKKLEHELDNLRNVAVEDTVLPESEKNLNKPSQKELQA